ncbi:MAG: cyclic nucleotide-binding domain-containing protein [Candidatus Obscuribacterales bacterium]|nr:cyclic nucleotide-binding domain-containing protein [Steroidobacteraceae bacterium]
MEQNAKPSDLALLRSFSPLDGMKAENLLALARKTTRREAPIGRVLFREGDGEKRTYYLLRGTVDLLQEGEVVATIRGGTKEAKNPLAHIIPRPYSAVVTSNRIEYLLIDSEFLDVMVTWDQTGAYEVSELNSAGEPETSTDDWMTTLLQTKAFHKVPPANIQAVFMRLQRMDYRAGEVVIKQGDVGDYFYIIVKGTCIVTRETPLNKEGIKLAELKLGDTFGEEALISEAKRNASVTMGTDGSLMRLGKDDFRKLLNEPFLEWVDYAEAKRLVAAGGQWLDVRLPSEFEHYHAEGALNIPLYFIRLKMKALDKNAHYIVCCDTGRRSSAGAYILSERGFQASVLRGGLNSTEIARK